MLGMKTYSQDYIDACRAPTENKSARPQPRSSKIVSSKTKSYS